MKTNYHLTLNLLNSAVKTRLSIILLIACLCNWGFAQAFDAAADFSATNNPGGVWSYGWSSTLGSQFNLYNEHKKILNDLDFWDTFNSTWNVPNIIHNPTANTITDTPNNITYQPGQLSFHPGWDGACSLVRWTSPVAGQANIAATFVGLDSDGTTVDVHVLLNGSSIFDGWINNYAVPMSYSGSVMVNVGDTIDFAVAYGSNYNLLDDTTGLAATITTVPEPATILLLGFGAIILRKKR